MAIAVRQRKPGPQKFLELQGRCAERRSKPAAGGVTDASPGRVQGME